MKDLLKEKSNDQDASIYIFHDSARARLVNPDSEDNMFGMSLSSIMSSPEQDSISDLRWQPNLTQQQQQRQQKKHCCTTSPVCPKRAKEEDELDRFSLGRAPDFIRIASRNLLIAGSATAA